MTYLFKRLISIIPVGVGVIILVSLLIHMIPGNPVDRLAGPYATGEDKIELARKLGLDKPLAHQLKDYLWGVLQGDLGKSLIYEKKVSELIKERFIPTVELAFWAMLVALLLSLPLGVWAALKANSFQDFMAMTFALLGVSIPNFWLGPLLILVFSIQLDLLPVSERLGWQSYILPSLTLGTSLAAILTRMTRTSLLENIKKDYTRTAYSKGLSSWEVLWKHVFRNSAIPVVTIVGLQFGALLTGSIITEKIFDWPGLGSLLIEAIGNRDYPLVQGCVLLFSFLYLLVNLLTDISYGLLDPRISFQEEK